MVPTFRAVDCAPRSWPERRPFFGAETLSRVYPQRFTPPSRVATGAGEEPVSPAPPGAGAGIADGVKDAGQGQGGIADGEALLLDAHLNKAGAFKDNVELVLALMSM